MTDYTLGIALFTGIAVAAFVWSFRNGVSRRISHDVAWLDEIRLRFKPDVKDSEKYIYYWYCLMFIVMMPLFYFLFSLKILGLALWLAIWFIPQLVADFKWKKRLEELDEQLPKMIRRLSILLGSGLSFTQSLKQLAEDIPPPMMYECLIMSQGWEMGENFDSIVASTAQRLDMPSFQLFSVIVIMNNQLGGNIVRTLEELSESLESQNAMKKELKAATAEGRASTLGLLAAPPLMLAIVTLIDSKAVIEMFNTWMGFGMLCVAGVFIGSGYYWARRIVRIDY